MAAKNTFNLKNLPAEDCVNRFTNFVSAFFKSERIFFEYKTTADNITLISDNCQANSISIQDAYKKFLEALKQYNFLEIIECRVRQQFPNGHLSVIYKSLSATIASISITWNNDSNANIPQNVNNAELLKELHSHFDLVKESVLVDNMIPAAQKAVLDEQRYTVKTLEEQTIKLANILQNQIEHDADYIRTLTKDLQGNYEEKRKQLEDIQQQKSAELDQRESEFKKRVADFDVRENTAVRRQLLGKITDLIQSQRGLEIPESTVKKRKIIHASCIITAVLGMTLAGSFAWKVLTTNAELKMYWPMSLGIIIFVSTMIFYLKWNDDWFREHAHAEFFNRKLNADILRASWIAELFLEDRHKEGVKLPAEVINSFTRNLFIDPYSTDKKYHPFDQLVEILGKVSKLKVGKNVCEISREPEIKEG